MKYYKNIGKQHHNTKVIVGVIYREDDKPNDSRYDLKKYHEYLPERYLEVTEREYWQQELDAGKFVGGAYYNFNDFVIWKYSHSNVGEYYISQNSLNRNRGNFHTPNIHKLATDEEIEWLELCNKQDKFITKEEFMKSKEFVLPERWYVKVTSDNADILTKWKFKVSGGEYYDSAIEYTYVNYKGAGIGKEKDTYYTEITFEQFKQYVLKEDIMNDKKIKEYRVKAEFSKLSESLFKHCPSNKKGGWDRFDYDSDAKFFYKEAGVLDLWFTPVLEEEFKVGDWIYYKYDGVNESGGSVECISSLERTVKTNKSHNLCETSKLQNGEYKDHIRKATPQEIEEAQNPKIQIKGYDANFITDKTVKFGCQSYDRKFVLALGDFLEKSDLKIESQEEIMKVVEHFKNN